jgi:CheY-like chemotaxis protein
VRHLVELHGVTVGVASPGEGRGATFTIRIPALDGQGETLAPPAVHATPGLSRLAGLAVLVVDDDAGSREILASMLEGYGARVTTVDTGERALSLLMQQPPDLLIADLAMPQMTGIDLIHRIRNLRTDQGGQVPAIAVSAFAAAPDRLLAQQAGFDSHVAKPVEPEELVRVLLDTLQRR